MKQLGLRPSDKWDCVFDAHNSQRRHKVPVRQLIILNGGSGDGASLLKCSRHTIAKQNAKIDGLCEIVKVILQQFAATPREWARQPQPVEKLFFIIREAALDGFRDIVFRTELVYLDQVF